MNTNFQEALLDILRDMTKQQMQQIFRPVLDDIEVMVTEKVVFSSSYCPMHFEQTGRVPSTKKDSSSITFLHFC